MLIKEVEDLLSISSHTLRYYEKMGLINPDRDSNGYRNYSEQDVTKLKQIRYLRDLDIPIESIVDIVEGNIDFQEFLENHIKSLETKIKSLQYVSDVCNNLKEKEIPILTALTDDKVVKEEKINENKLRKEIHKLTEYFKPLKTIVIGIRTDRAALLSAQPALIVISLFMGICITIGIPNMVHNINDYGIIKPIKIFETNVLSMIISSLISYLIVSIIYFHNNGFQRYIELTDNNIYVCDYKNQGSISVFLGTIFNDSRKRNRKYYWEELEKVEIDVNFKRMSGAYILGTSTSYVPMFKFYFNDGNMFVIESGLSFDEDVQTAYKILKDKDVDIFATEHIKKYFGQHDISSYEYFEAIYHKNTKK